VSAADQSDVACVPAASGGGSRRSFAVIVIDIVSTVDQLAKKAADPSATSTSVRPHLGHLGPGCLSLADHIRALASWDPTAEPDTVIADLFGRPDAFERNVEPAVAERGPSHPARGCPPSGTWAAGARAPHR
jgi:hypothetical protein